MFLTSHSYSYYITTTIWTSINVLIKKLKPNTSQSPLWKCMALENFWNSMVCLMCSSMFFNVGPKNSVISIDCMCGRSEICWFALELVWSPALQLMVIFSISSQNLPNKECGVPPYLRLKWPPAYWEHTLAQVCSNLVKNCDNSPTQCKSQI